MVPCLWNQHVLSPTTGLLLLFFPFLDPLPFLLGFFHYLFVPCRSAVFTTYVCSVVQLCATLGKPMNYSSPGSSVHGILQARLLEWVSFPLQGIFLTQGLNLGLLHCRQNFHHLSHQGRPSLSVLTTYWEQVFRI